MTQQHHHARTRCQVVQGVWGGATNAAVRGHVLWLEWLAGSGEGGRARCFLVFLRRVRRGTGLWGLQVRSGTHTWRMRLLGGWVPRPADEGRWPFGQGARRTGGRRKTLTVRGKGRFGPLGERAVDCTCLAAVPFFALWTVRSPPAWCQAGSRVAAVVWRCDLVSRTPFDRLSEGHGNTDWLLRHQRMWLRVWPAGKAAFVTGFEKTAEKRLTHTKEAGRACVGGTGGKVPWRAVRLPPTGGCPRCSRNGDPVVCSSRLHDHNARPVCFSGFTVKMRAAAEKRTRR